MIGSNASSYKLKEDIIKLKAVAKKIFENLEAINVFTLNFDMLNHETAGQSRFRLLGLFDASPYKTFNFVMKTFMRMTSREKKYSLGGSESVEEFSFLGDIMELK